MATKKPAGEKARAVRRQAPRKPPLPDASERVVEDLLMRTRERWLKESSFAIMCCTENRTGKE